jgi:DNA-binding beta-propeller fold protein YncE
MHFDPLRPNRVYGPVDRYEFAHGTNSVCIYEIDSLDFVKEIAVGERPDCHGTSVDNRYLYIACADGLHCIDQDTLEVVKVVDTGHVFAVNVMPDGSTMLLHDAFGAILVLTDIQDMTRIHVAKRLQMHDKGTVGGKGHFIEDGRFYLVNGWDVPAIYTIDLEHDYAVDLFLEDASMLHLPDDLVVTADGGKAYSACYHPESYVAVTDIAAKKVIGKIRTGCGTCGLTMTNDERYVVASNDQDDTISVIDTVTDQVVATHSAHTGFEKLGITGYIQGISVGRDDSIYVYGCSGSGAIVRFRDVTSSGEWTISHPGGKDQSRKGGS